MITIKVLNVEGMSCSHCEKAVTNALNELNGVSDTKVDLKGKTATVTYDTELVTEADMKEAIEDAGYEIVL